MKPILADCPSCSSSIELPPDMAGQSVLCPQCQTGFVPNAPKTIPAWILPLVVAIFGIGASFSLRLVPDQYLEHHDWPAIISVIGLVVFLWGLARLVFTVVKPEHRGIAVVLTGVCIMLFCWLVSNSLPGIVVGGFVAVIGMNLFARRGAGKAA
jgi:hypothetical protein